MPRRRVKPKNNRSSRPRIILHVKTPIEREEAEIAVLKRIDKLLAHTGRIAYTGGWEALQRFAPGTNERMGDPVAFPKDRTDFTAQVLTGLINYIYDMDKYLEELADLLAALGAGTANLAVVEFPMPHYSYTCYTASDGPGTLRDVLQQCAEQNPPTLEKLYGLAEEAVHEIRSRVHDLQVKVVSVWPLGLAYWKDRSMEQQSMLLATELEAFLETTAETEAEAEAESSSEDESESESEEEV